MNAKRTTNVRRRATRRLLAGVVLGAAAALVASPAASAAVTATFSPGSGTLSVSGDGAANTITVSRNAAGAILVNNGAVAIRGGTPTVANTALIQVSSLGGHDTVT